MEHFIAMVKVAAHGNGFRAFGRATYAAAAVACGYYHAHTFSGTALDPVVYQGILAFTVFFAYTQGDVSYSDVVTFSIFGDPPEGFGYGVRSDGELFTHF
jgi:hypothetical protein